MERSRKQKMIMIAVVAVAVIGLTVAFAAMSTSLLINGTASMDTAKWDIHFENLSAAKLTGFASVATEPELEATKIGDYDVVLTRPGDSVTYTFDVVNKGSMDAELSTFTKSAPVCTSPTGVTNDANIVCSNLKYTFKYTSNNEDVKVNDTLKAGETKNITLQLSYEGSTLPSAKVNISDLGITMVYNQMIGSTDNEVAQATATECFGFDESTGTINDWYCYEGNDKGLATVTDVVIPSTINGVKVTIIGESAFDSYGLTSVKLPEYLETIESAAFPGNQISNLIIPNNVTYIGPSAFDSNTTLTNLTLGESVEYIGGYAFSRATLTSLTIPASVKIIEEQAFGSYGITNVALSNVTIKGKSSKTDFDSIADDAFGWAEGYSDDNIIWEP